MSERTLDASFLPNRVADPNERHGSLAAWCPWCEDVHFHGAGGEGDTPRIEERGAHCCPASASPYLETGYALVVKSRMRDAAHMLPTAPMTSPARQGRARDQHRPKLWHRLSADSPRLIKRLLAAITGKTPRCLNFDQTRLPDGTRLNIYAAGETWKIEGIGNADMRGQGILALAATLYGLPEEVAFIRIIEAVMGLTFDAEALESFMNAYREWCAAGKPERRHT